MVKIINNVLVKVYQNIIVHLEDKIKFKKDYSEVIITRKKLKVKKRIDNLKSELGNRRLDLAIKFKVENEEIKTFIENKIKKLEDVFYWKQRALKASYARKINKKEDKSVLEKKYQDKKLQYENQLALKKETIINKYSVAPLENEQYTRDVQNLEKMISNKISDLENQLSAKLESLQKKTGKKLESFNKRIEFFKEKLQIVIQKSEVKDYNLDEGIILRLEDLTMRFGGLVAVDHLSFDVKKGEIFGLIGPNGAGKTTVFNCITKFYKPKEGRIIYQKNQIDTVLLNDYKVHQIIKQGIVRTFQNVELIWELSVIDNLLVAAHTLFKTGFFGQLIHTRKLHQEELVLRKKAENILSKMGLLAYKDSYPLGLPYGILKKIELARTLMVEPKLIILDEPAAGLNDAETLELAKIIKMIRDEENVTIFLVEHDMGLVMDICDTVCAISFGKKLAIGTPKEIQENKLVRDAYLGEE